MPVHANQSHLRITLLRHVSPSNPESKIVAFTPRLAGVPLLPDLGPWTLDPAPLLQWPYLFICIPFASFVRQPSLNYEP